MFKSSFFLVMLACFSLWFFEIEFGFKTAFSSSLLLNYAFYEEMFEISKMN